MKFRTHIDIATVGVKIDHCSQMMLLGSCFSEQIGKKLLEHKFKVDINPFGILYNPFSILNSINRLLSGRKFTVDELFSYNGKYHSSMHHGSFSSPVSEHSLKLINNRFVHAVETLLSADFLLITFGTAWVYQHKYSQRIVSNCHKLPANQFRRFRLSVKEIVSEWKLLISGLKLHNSKLKFLFTVSPVRHLKDGAHENQLSKSVLFLAIEELQQLFSDILFYFPAYEIMHDELRDYRFYSDDMMHPSSLAVNYIWDRFAKFYFSKETCQINKEWSLIRNALEHRPLYPKANPILTFFKRHLISSRCFQNVTPTFHVIRNEKY